LDELGAVQAPVPLIELQKCYYGNFGEFLDKKVCLIEKSRVKVSKLQMLEDSFGKAKIGWVCKTFMSDDVEVATKQVDGKTELKLKLKRPMFVPQGLPFRRC
jgi:hypothetical protein